jgi:hypothetical protein
MLFTILVDYRGGTYIAQVQDDHARAALVQWSKRVKDSDLKVWRLSRYAVDRIAKETLISIEGLTNVWCVSTTTAGDHLLLLDIVATLSREPLRQP